MNDHLVDRLGFRQFGNQPFRPADHGTPQVQVGGCRGAAGQDEGFERFQAFIHRIDFRFQPVHLGLGNAQRAFGLSSPFGSAQVGAKIEQVVLDAAQHGVVFAAGVQPGAPNHPVGFVHGAVGGDPKVMFRHPDAVAQGRLPAIAAAGIDFAQGDHVRDSGFEIQAL